MGIKFLSICASVLFLRSFFKEKSSVFEMLFSRAICRGISKSLAKDAQRIDGDHHPIDEILMQLHHENYVKTLKSLGIKVTEIESDPKLPDCVFTEDAAVVCGNKAVVTRLGHPNRRG